LRSAARPFSSGFPVGGLTDYLNLRETAGGLMDAMFRKLAISCSLPRDDSIPQWNVGRRMDRYALSR
jgi:hypothetical protein